MSKYTSREVQQIIDDLDYAQAFFSNSNWPESKQVVRSLKNASDLLTDLPDEVIETLDKKRDVFEPVEAGSWPIAGKTTASI